MNAVYFELGEPDGLRSRFLADADDFECWLHDLAEEIPGGYPQAALAKLAEISLGGAAALKTTCLDEASLIDRLMHDYWTFCTMTSRHGGKDITPVSRVRYPAELSQVLPTASDEMCDYYRRLFAGNSLAECDGHSYRSADGVFRWSWLLPHEVQEFCDKLQGHAHLLADEDGVLEILEVLHLAKGCSLLISIA